MGGLDEWLPPAYLGLRLGGGYRNRLTDRAGLQYNNPSDPRSKFFLHTQCALHSTQIFYAVGMLIGGVVGSILLESTFPECSTPPGRAGTWRG
jgi:hypothetical protein